ncbi:MAG: ATP-binding cassette domain-containing protein, partial [Clostridia bacterium]|nr:ATP-binding cassette domain-containing protein [Clostridia bacterium]
QDVAKIKNREFDKLRPNMQMIFQDPYASLSPRLTVGEIIGESARQHGLVNRAGFHDYVLNVMNMCGLQPHYFERYPHEFSGGQRQRICIARALALKPSLVVCDEPVSALDVSIQAQVINMLIELREKLGLTYIFISHDLSVVKHISDEVGVMYLGNIVEYGSKESIFNNTLHPYTKALFSAVPVPNPHVKMNRIMLKGDIPSPVNPPKGCKFHTRCEHCMEICGRIAPEYREIEAGHFCACHLYNSAEDTARLLEQADINDAEEKARAEKEAKKPWNVVKTKVVTTAKNIFKKKNKEESAQEVAVEPEAAVTEEVKAQEFPEGTVVQKVTTVTTVETFTTIETVGSDGNTATEELSKSPAEYSVTTRTEESVSAIEQDKTGAPEAAAEPAVEQAPASEAVAETDKVEEVKKSAPEKTAAAKSGATKSSTASTAAKKPAATKSATAKPTATKTTTAKASTAKTSAAKPAGTKSTAAK